MKVKLLNNILPKEINNKIIIELTNSHWFIAWDGKESRYKKIFSNKNAGFSMDTVKNGQIHVNNILNTYADVIFNIILDKLKINVEKIKLNRFFWNMYLKNSDSDLHVDRDDSKFISILYNLHTTDGGTEIDGIFYKDLEGQAKVYNSNILHRGIGPQVDNVRFNLNIIFEYEPK